MHSFDNEPIEPNELKPIFDGPIRSAQPAIAAELAKVEVLEPGMRS